MPYGEALKKYGDNLRVAPLAVVEEADKSHISHHELLPGPGDVAKAVAADRRGNPAFRYCAA